MKAVILAGGEGIRLRPLTLERSRGMLPMFGRPVLEHVLLLLRKNGFDEVVMVLGHQPERVRDYFGEGTEWGVRLSYFEGLKDVAAIEGNEDVILIPGDCLCDFDLRSCIQDHKSSGRDATLLLHRENEPEGRVIQLDQHNRVIRVVEEPGWGVDYPSLADTGICLLSSKLIEVISDDEKVLIPTLLQQGVEIYGDIPYGYWRMLTDGHSYLAALADGLDGKVKLEMLLPQAKPGVWSASPLPESCALVPPCWIGARVTLGENCLIGPHTVLEQGSFLGDRTVAQRSVLLGAAVGNDSTLHGAILCEDSCVGRGCTLAEGSVLGEQAILENHVVLREGVRIWPRIPVGEGSRLTCSVTGGGQAPRVCFEAGAIRGSLAQEITPELLLTLGSVLGWEERVALGCTPGVGGSTLLMAAAAGVSAAGSIPWVHDGTTWGAAAWFSLREQLHCGLFIEVEGERCRLWIFDERGLPLNWDQSRRIEGALRRQEIHRAVAGAMGKQEQARGIDAAYCNAAVHWAGRCANGFTVCVPEEGRENRLMANALQTLGCKVLRERRQGVPAFWSGRGGRLLFGEDETGRKISPEQLMLVVILELIDGGEEELHLPWDAPMAAVELVEEMGGCILKGTASREHVQRQLALRDGVYAACLICRRLSRTGETLRELRNQLPDMGISREEIPLEGSRAETMENLRRYWPQGEMEREGLKLRLSGGWAWIRSANDRPVLKLRCEAKTAEMAAELCSFVRSRAIELQNGGN